MTRQSLLTALCTPNWQSARQEPPQLPKFISAWAGLLSSMNAVSPAVTGESWRVQGRRRFTFFMDRLITHIGGPRCVWVTAGEGGRVAEAAAQ
jgi:hypothetical protein